MLDVGGAGKEGRVLQDGLESAEPNQRHWQNDLL